MQIVGFLMRMLILYAIAGIWIKQKSLCVLLFFVIIQNATEI